MMRILKQDELFSLIISLLPPKAFIVEVGAYTGNHTLKFIQKLPEATVFCFEPVPEIYYALKNNVLPYQNIHTFNMAVSNHDGTALLHVAHNPKKVEKFSSASSLLKPHNRLHFSPIMYDKTIEVNIITLDTWHKKNNIKNNIDLVWIDAQGHEYEILRCAKNFLSRVKYIHSEVHFNQAYEHQKNYTEVIELLKTYDFIEIARDFENTSEWFFGNILFKKSK